MLIGRRILKGNKKVSNFKANLLQANTLNGKVIQESAELQKLRLQRDETIIYALDSAKSTDECLSLRPLATHLYQKWLVSLLAIRHFNPQVGTAESLHNIQILFWKGRNSSWSYNEGTEESFKTAYRQHDSFRYLLSTRFNFHNSDGWSAWPDFLCAQAEIADNLYVCKRERLLSRMNLTGLHTLHKSGHTWDKQLFARFKEIMKMEGVVTPVQLKQLYGSRPKEWMLSLLKWES